MNIVPWNIEYNIVQGYTEKRLTMNHNYQHCCQGESCYSESRLAAQSAIKKCSNKLCDMWVLKLAWEHLFMWFHNIDISCKHTSKLITAETRKLLAKPSLHTRQTSIATIDCDCAFKYDFFGCRFFCFLEEESQLLITDLLQDTNGIYGDTTAKNTSVFFFCLRGLLTPTTHFVCCLEERFPNWDPQTTRGHWEGCRQFPAKG